MKLGFTKKAKQALLLKPLTPDYIPEQHGFYVEQLDAAISNESIYNIALSGGYGVGKSSILKKIAEIHDSEAIEISMSTLGPFAEHTEESPNKSRSNLIQQEIVKQILYREETSQTPSSRFKRIKSFNLSREVTLSLLCAVAVAACFIVTGWTTLLGNSIPEPALIGQNWNLTVFIASFFWTLAFRRIFHGRMGIKQFTAGAASVTLDEGSASYFDQYLDEIVYFFEVSKRRLVIFEDIDRFNDARIFDSLRALNLLLNSSSQIKGPVKFIYAIRDSIFEAPVADDTTSPSVKASPPEVRNSGRTKFFDLVIPVVPFIAHQSVRDLAPAALSGIGHSISAELIDVASKHLPDMRLLKNAANEFLVFRNQILEGKGAGLGLSDTGLFAMILYKSAHLSDFEAIRLGTSNLDKVYEESRKTIAVAINRLELEIRQLRLARSENEANPERLKRLGVSLMSWAATFSNMVYPGQATNRFFQIGPNQLSEEYLQEERFWRELEENQNTPLTLLVRSRFGGDITLTLTKTTIEELIGPLDINAWRRFDAEDSNELEQQKLAEIRRLRGADMGFLLASEAQEGHGIEFSDFEKFAKSTLETDLAYQLIKTGFIDSSFSLYSAVFHGVINSPQATNFIIHHIDRDAPDENFHLSRSDAASIVRERKIQIGEPASYNIDLLDYLIETPEHEPQTASILKALMTLGDEQVRFLRTYLNRGDHAEAFVKLATPLSPKFFNFLLKELDGSSEAHIGLLNVALSNLPKLTLIPDTAKLAQFLSKNISRLEIFHEELADQESLSRAAALVSRAGFRHTALGELSSRAAIELASRKAFAINRGNLKIALRDNHDFALDAIADFDDDLYNYVLKDLNGYSESLRPSEFTVRRGENFGRIVNAIYGQDESIVDFIVAKASPECILDDIESAPTSLWPTLTRNQRVAASAKNISAAIAETKSIDSNIARMLQRPEAISEPDKISEDEKEIAAASIISASSHLSPPERARLCAKLDLENYILVSDIEPESGPLLSLLLKENIIEDSADSFKSARIDDWETKELLISASSKFVEFVSPEFVGSDLGRIIESCIISPDVKKKIVSSAHLYSDKCSSEELSSLIDYALANELTMPLPIVARAATIGRSKRNLLQIFARSAKQASADELISTLPYLGDEFAKIASQEQRRPRVPYSEEALLVLDQLKLFGLIRKYDREGDQVVVRKRRIRPEH